MYRYLGRVHAYLLPVGTSGLPAWVPWLVSFSWYLAQDTGAHPLTNVAAGGGSSVQLGRQAPAAGMYPRQVPGQLAATYADRRTGGQADRPREYVGLSQILQQQSDLGLLLLPGQYYQ